MKYETFEQIIQPQFDYQNIDRLPAEMLFFQSPMGYQERDGHIKTSFDTSMMLHGRFGAEVTFLVTGARVLFIPDWPLHRGNADNDEHDARAALLGGKLELLIQNRCYLQCGPLAMFPSCLPSTWMAKLGEVAEGEESAHWEMVYSKEFSETSRLPYLSIVPLLITVNQYFGVRLRMEPRELRSPGRLGVILDGRLTRGVC